MDIRTFLRWSAPYHTINREERNLAAILYHTLLINNNVYSFLESIDYPEPINIEEFAVYFEYSFVRDIWHNIDRNNSNHIKREFILQSLQISNEDELRKMNTREFNSFFGAIPRPSIDYIQSPSNWNILKYTANAETHIDFLKICKLKWAFNAKPDIVIHTSNDHALCIEAKLESREGQYPTNVAEVKVFSQRSLERVRQTTIQCYVMEELLGLQTQFLFLTQGPSIPSSTHISRTWKEVFSSLDVHNTPIFIQRWIERL